MIDDFGDASELLHLVASGDQEADRILFSQYRDRLKRMVHLRLSRRLAGRVDDSDVLQEAFIEVARKLPDYARGAVSPEPFPQNPSRALAPQQRPQADQRGCCARISAEGSGTVAVCGYT